jgi:hypothetical protein
MRNTPYFLFPLLAVTALTLGWGCGDDGGGTGGSGGQGVPCDSDADCEDDNECTFEFCISQGVSDQKVCSFELADEGPAPGAEQTDGDCMSIDCVSGEVVTVTTASDPADDPNGQDCMVPACEEGTNVMVPEETGDNCDAGNGNGVCDDVGTCSCNILAGMDGVAFVDPDNGQDIPSNGGANGSCAFATIEYALTQAPGEIRLPLQAFTVTEALVLTGTQWLNCAFDQDNNTRTQLSGSGPYGLGSAAVAFEGDRNGIDDCDIDASGATSVVVVTSSAVGAPHFIDDAILANATGDGVTIDGNNLDLTDTAIQNNGVGVMITTLDARAFLDDNIFGGNGTDIICADESPQVTGQGNGAISCMTCGSCGNF